MSELTPCQEDYQQYGREWTEDAPPRTRTELAYMATLCQGCPIREQCFAQGKAGQTDADGRWAGHSTGVWGGFLWRRGRPIDPLSIQDGSLTPPSVYYRVHWDRVRRQWKAQAEVRDAQGHPFKKHLGYFDDEDEAGRAVVDWERKNGRDAA